MKRIALFIATLGLSLGLRAQADSLAVADSLDSSPCDTCWENRPRIQLNLGIQAGASLLASDETSPYYSKYDFRLEIPLVIYHNLTPHWTLSGGLKYMFLWSPLYYRVATTADGLDFPTVPETSTQHAHAFFGYLGIPLQVNWHPVSHHPNHLILSADIFAGYALTRHVSITETDVTRTGSNTSIGSDEYTGEGDFLLPWKLEVGLTVSTSRLGLLHGVRFFADLLPTYEDAVTGDRLHTFGMTFFL